MEVIAKNKEDYISFSIKVPVDSYIDKNGEEKDKLIELRFIDSFADYSSAEYRVIAIILDIANFRLFRLVRSDVPAENPKHFMKIKFFNKAVDAINLLALL